jgi:hypothetical protein
VNQETLLLFFNILKTSLEQMDLYLYLSVPLRLAFLFLHDGFEKRTFGEFAITGILGFLGMVALGTRGLVFLVEVGFNEFVFVLLGVYSCIAHSLILH